MYCYTCGARLAKVLSYCNHCGANLSALKGQGQAGTAIDTLLWVTVGTTITFLGMALGALVLMKNGAIDEGLGTAFVILTLVALVVSEGALVWRFLQMNRSAEGIRNAPRRKDLSAEKPAPLTERALHEPSSRHRVSPSRPPAP